MKTIIIFSILACLFIIGCNDQTPLNKTNISLISEYVTIDIFTPSGWSLTINQDGSGEIGYGSNPTDFAAF